MSVLAKIKIEIPPEAIVPVLIGIVTLLILIFAGAALADWKERRPKVAVTTGLVLAVALTGYVIYEAAMLLPEKYIDLGPPGHPPISLADGPILGFSAIIATLFWRFANQPKVSLALGVLLGVALIAKPFVIPLYSYFSSGSERARGLTDPDTISILGPGVATLIAGLMVGLRPRSTG